MGKRIYLGALNGRIRELDFDGKLLRTSNHWYPVELRSEKVREINAICLSPDGQNLFTGSMTGEVAVWDRQDLKYLGVLRPGNDGEEIIHLELSDDGQRVALVQGIYNKFLKDCSTQLYLISPGSDEANNLQMTVGEQADSAVERL